MILVLNIFYNLTIIIVEVESNLNDGDNLL